MAHRPRGRKRPLPRYRITGAPRLSAWGPYAYDAKTGVLHNVSQMIPQGGGLVARDRRYGTNDYEDDNE